MKPGDFLANVARFWDRVDRTQPECWVWTGETNRFGYGRFEFRYNGTRTRILAHRLSLILIGQRLTDTDVVRHTCDNPPCVNPEHLLVGTQADNIRDAIERGRHNGTGLALGRAPTWPPRPCRGCGVTVTEGHHQYCPSCKSEAARESQRRYKAKREAL